MTHRPLPTLLRRWINWQRTWAPDPAGFEHHAETPGDRLQRLNQVLAIRRPSGVANDNPCPHPLLKGH